MTIDEIIRQAADMCNIELVPEQGDRRYTRLKSAVEYGIVQAARVLKRKKTETVAVVNGLISYNAFSMGVVEVVSVRMDNRSVKWMETEDGFYIGEKDGTAEVTYVPCPLSLTKDSVPPIPETVFAHRNYAYFAASEFLAGEGRHTDARAFDARWEHALYGGRGRLRMPLGRWI